MKREKRKKRKKIDWPLNAKRPKMVRHTLKILEQILQDFQSVSDHFGASCIKGLNVYLQISEYITESRFFIFYFFLQKGIEMNDKIILD